MGGLSLISSDSESYRPVDGFSARGTGPALSVEEKAPRRKEGIAHGRTAEHLFHPACNSPSFQKAPLNSSFTKSSGEPPRNAQRDAIFVLRSLYRPTRCPSFFAHQVLKIPLHYFSHQQYSFCCVSDGDSMTHPKGVVLYKNGICSGRLCSRIWAGFVR